VASGGRALERDVGDARREGARHAEDLLVDEVGGAVRGEPERGGRRRHAVAEQALAGDDVVELDLQREPVAVGHDPADDHEIRLQQPPLREVDLAGVGGLLQHRGARQRLEAPAALEVGADDLRGVDRQRPGAAEGHDRDRDRGRDTARDLHGELRMRGRAQRGKAGAECGEEHEAAKVRHRGQTPA
jgi:hypothetical protein